MSKSKFDPNAAFKNIIGLKKEEVEQAEVGTVKQITKKTEGNRGNRVQKAYFLDKDLFKALQKKAMLEEINLTEAINQALRNGLEEYL